MLTVQNYKIYDNITQKMRNEYYIQAARIISQKDFSRIFFTKTNQMIYSVIFLRLKKTVLYIRLS